MSLRRPSFLNGIGGQLAGLVIFSLIVIHAVVVAGVYLSQRFETQRTEGGPGEVIALARLLSEAPAGAERDTLLARAKSAFPLIHVSPATFVPKGDERGLHLGYLRTRIGAGFVVSPGDDPDTVAVQLPDRAAYLFTMPHRPFPPFISGPVTLTVLFVIVSMSMLLLWAARALRSPLSAFASAAETFSLEGAVAPLPERGPEEIRAVARAFNRMRERIRKLVDDRTRMLAAMGHDLRTPITRLRLRSEFIADEDIKRQMLRDLDQMKTMTEGALVFLRDGTARDTATAMDLASVLQTVCDQYTDMGHAVSYEGPGRATVRARPEDIERAVANLVDNAVRHGTATVVRLSTTAAHAVIEVEDDGPGIPDAQKQNVLEAFVRGNEARTMDQRTGFGLGLAIVRAIVEAHGGQLTLNDRAPSGLIAGITLPA